MSQELQATLNRIAQEQQEVGSWLVIVTDLAHWAACGVKTQADFDAYCQAEADKEARKSRYDDQEEEWEAYQEECRRMEAAAMAAAQVRKQVKLGDACPQLMELFSQSQQAEVDAGYEEWLDEQADGAEYERMVEA